MEKKLNAPGLINTARNVSKCGVIFGPYFPVFRLNMDQKWLRIWTLHAIKNVLEKVPKRKQQWRRSGVTIVEFKQVNDDWAHSWLLLLPIWKYGLEIVLEDIFLLLDGDNPANIYLLIVNNGNTRTRRGICSHLTLNIFHTLFYFFYC